MGVNRHKGIRFLLKYVHIAKSEAYNNINIEQRKINLSFFIKTIDFYRNTCIIIEHLKIRYRGVEQLVARRAHNPEAAGSSPVSATILNTHKGLEKFLWVFGFFTDLFALCNPVCFFIPQTLRIRFKFGTTDLR